MIHLDNVSYTFKKGGGVTNVNLDINESEFVFMIGPTGSGKTTMLRLIYMDILPQVGNIVVNKFTSSGMKPKKLPKLRQKIGMVFQNYLLMNDRDLFENVALPLHVLGFPKRQITELVEKSLDEFGLSNKLNHYPHELSGGEQQRACVARAMIKDPGILLADEPTGNLDPVTSFELIKIFEKINKAGTTILMASHNYNLIKGRGHRIIEIQNGSVRS